MMNNEVNAFFDKMNDINDSQIEQSFCINNDDSITGSRWKFSVFIMSDILRQDSNIFREDSPKQWTNIQLVELYSTHQLVFSNNPPTLPKTSQNHGRKP